MAHEKRDPSPGSSEALGQTFEPLGGPRAHRPEWYRPTRLVPAMIPPGLDAIEVASWFGLDGDAMRFSMFCRLIRLGRKPGESPVKEWIKLVEEARRGLELEEGRVLREGVVAPSGLVSVDQELALEETLERGKADLSAAPTAQPSAATFRDAHLRQAEEARRNLSEAMGAEGLAWARLETAWTVGDQDGELERLARRLEICRGEKRDAVEFYRNCMADPV